MSVLVLGTGAADGWPNAHCDCTSCVGERAAGRIRAQTSALIDAHVLVDAGPGTAEAAQRLGADLAGVDLMLFSHAHSDHFSPALLMYRSWVTDRPLTVLGPPDVIANARRWVSADAPITWLHGRPGNEYSTGDVHVRVLESSHRTGLGVDGEPDAVLFDIAATQRVLWASDTGALPASTVKACTGVGFDVVLMEETFGERLDLAGTGHLAYDSFEAQLTELRGVGAITEATDVVAVHLSHHHASWHEAQTRLAHLGARAVLDGAKLDHTAR